MRGSRKIAPKESCPPTITLTLFSPNLGKYGPEKTPYLDTFHAMGDNFARRKLSGHNYEITGKLTN